jgi:hypothetical protein
MSVARVKSRRTGGFRARGLFRETERGAECAGAGRTGNGGRTERGRALAETVPDGGACTRSTTCKKGKVGSSARTTGNSKRKSTRATHEPSKKAKKT